MTLVVSLITTLMTACKQQAIIPVVGHKFHADFSVFAVELFFESESKLTYTSLKSGVKETVAIKMTEIRTNVYMVTWQEQDKTTVTHVEDFQNGIVYTNITQPTNEFINLKGTLTQKS